MSESATMLVEEEYDLAGQVIGLAMKVHRALGPGFLESVYLNALCVELGNAGIAFEREKSLVVYYQGTVVGEFRADLWIQTGLIIEAKAILALATTHEVQLANYLTATKQDAGLLLNFGSGSLEYKRKFRNSKPKSVVVQFEENLPTR